jgi:Cdc6-like AAA superfamily ATPase
MPCQSLGLLSRKAATVAGDLRAALKICQRTIELYRDQKDDIARKKAIYEEQMAERAAQEAALFTKGIRDGVTSNSIEDISDALAPVPPPAETSMMKLITRATTEYKESPMMATMSRLCTLDKALLVAACKHLRATDSMEINADTLWCRLGDLLQLARQNPEITLLTPPQFIFDEALDRLVKLGLFDQTGRRGSEMGRGGGNAAGSALGSTRYGPRAQSFTFNLEFTDVVACLKEDLLAKFL